jgi:hypothetical protein
VASSDGRPADEHTRVPAATYTYWVADDRWDWSEEMFRLHGAEPGEVVPTTGLLLSHKHPEDAGSVGSILAAATGEGRAFVCRHRIIDAEQHERTVVAFGFPQPDADGGVRAVHGVLADVTARLARDTREATAAAVEGATATRAVIDEAKGCLMGRYGLDADTAFEVLRAASNHTNRKLHDIAGQLVELLTAQPTADGGPARALAEVETILLNETPRNR